MVGRGWSRVSHQERRNRRLHAELRAQIFRCDLDVLPNAPGDRRTAQ
jgi:hypothetical protein